MASERYNTWNPALELAVMRGGIADEELRRRTLSLTYIDRARKFDEIEWKLENADGLLTRPEYLATGLTITVRLGYLSDMFPAKAFIINGVDGGVGVFGQKDPPVGSNESTITFKGRNRNAPTPRKKGKKGGKGAGTGAKPTSDVLQYEMLRSPPKGATSFPAYKTTSDIVKALAREAGFSDDYVLAEPTKDLVENGGRLQSGESYMEYCIRQSRRFGYVFKVDHLGLHFHSPRWAPASNKTIRETFEYSADRDSLRLRLVGDFELPLPKKVTAKSYDPMNCYVNVADVQAAMSGQTHNMATFVLANYNAPGKVERQANLLRDEIIIASTSTASAKAAARFIDRHQDALKLEAEVVGNPRVLALHLVRIKRTGNPIVDGIWFVDEARHMFEGLDYRTKLTLNAPPASVKRATDIIWVNVGDPAVAMQGQKQNEASFVLKGLSSLKGTGER